ncbi:hypothetical protein HOE04_00890, partial [archaeon]|nr:hypothetical protein [archaeon]
MKKKGVKKRTKILLITLTIAITILIILSSYNYQIQKTIQNNIDKNQKQLSTNPLKISEKTKEVFQTITNTHPVDLVLEILNINDIFYKRGLILYSDITGYGYGDPIPEPDPDPYPNPDPGSKCQTNQDCDDDNICNGQEFCEQGICMFGNTLNCEDNDPCTHDYCANNQCVNNPLPDCQKK